VSGWIDLIRFLVFNATFSNISAISWRPVLVVEEAGVPGESLKIPKGQSESVYRRRTDSTMVKRKSTKGQTTIYKTYT